MLSRRFINLFSCTYPGVDFAFASYYADHMVLQRAAVGAAVWGYAFAVGDEVTVDVDQGGSYTTTAAEGTVIVSTFT